MARDKELRVLVATDGSKSAWAAIVTTALSPWPTRSRVRVIVARESRAPHRRSVLLAALDRGPDQAGDSAQHALSRRWPDVEVRIADKSPVRAILDEARRFAADVIVVGWRGHGPIRRLLMGSVSRGIVRGARCAVLVVRRPERIRRIVIGFDESPNARRALTLVCRLPPPADGQVTIVSAVMLTKISRRTVPGAAAVAAEIRRTNKLRSRTALKELNRAAAELKRHRWPTRSVLVHGEPLRELIGAVAAARADILVVGARGTSGVRRLLLGSVAEGALNRSPVAVLVAR